MFSKGLHLSVARRSPALKVLVSGDFCPLGRPQQLLRRGKGAEVMEAYQSVAKQSDLAITNLEATLTRARTPIDKAGPNLKVDPECAGMFEAGGINAVALANNHLGDFGTRPVGETLEHLDRAGIRHCGAGRNLVKARKPLRLTRKGVRLAILNCAENEFGGAQARKAGVSTLDPLANIADIREAAASVDIVLVIVHGGNEHNPLPSPGVCQRYRAFAEAGASAVIGNHTHCPQGVEVWQGVPIFYSLGNFLFDPKPIGLTFFRPSFWWVGYSVLLELDRKGMIGFQIIPHTFAPESVRIRFCSQKGEKAFGKYLSRISTCIQNEKTIQRHWEAWCAHVGPGLTEYLAQLVIPPKDKKQHWHALVARNTYTCEAHRESLATFFRLFEERRVKEAAARWNAVAKLQVVPAALARELHTA